MKKVLLVLTLGMAAVVMTSCFGRECVCKTVAKEDGKKTRKAKEIVYKKAEHATQECKDIEDNNKEYTETIGGVEYKYTMKCK